MARPESEFSGEMSRDTYFSLWSFTDKGMSDPAALEETIRTASAMIRDAGAKCRLYVAVGGRGHLIGVASGKSLDDTSILAIQQAIGAFGTLHTEFIKGREFSLEQYADHLREVDRFHKLCEAKPEAGSAKGSKARRRRKG